MRRSMFEISDELRLKTLVSLLSGKSPEDMAEEFGISRKGVKYRLTSIYKYYNVKNRYELMAKFVQIPSEALVVMNKGADLPMGSKFL